ncbi:MAG: SUF system NifU family Fe-S cluster assembly protein [Polyangiaceae bacterium]
MTPELRDLYQGLLLEHNARPRNLGPLPSPTHEATLHNALCGDQVTVRLRVEAGRVVEARFEGEGCALSRASASMLTLAVAGRDRGEIAAIRAELSKLLARGAEHEAADRERLGDLVSLEGVRDVPSRRRCATLPWEALDAALGPPGGEERAR